MTNKELKKLAKNLGGIYDKFTDNSGEWININHINGRGIEFDIELEIEKNKITYIRFYRENMKVAEFKVKQK